MDGGKFSAEEFEKRLSSFEAYVNQITQRDSDINLEERRKKLLETIKFNDFFTKLGQIFELDLDEYYVKRLFKKICNNPDSRVEWSEVFGYTLEENNLSFNGVIEEANTNDFLDEIQIFLASLKYRFGDASGESSRRDIIQAIHYTPEIDSFITVALKGAVSVWTNRLKLQSCTFLKEQSDGWLNGCCFMPNIKRIAITAERTLTLWDYRNNKQSKTSQMTLLTIQGLSALTCIDSIDKVNSHQESDKLIFGDTFGNVMTLEIDLNHMSYNNTKPDLVDSHKRVLDLDDFRDVFVKKKVHDQAVMKVKYIPEISSFVSCSTCEKASLVIEELYKFEKKDVKINRQAGIPKGLNTFCYCAKLNLIVTGGADKIIRLFNPLVVNKTCAKLTGHLFTIVELVCNEKDQQLISLSSERVFRVWDLTTYKCLQVFSDTENRPGERRVYCMHFDQKRDRLLTGSSVLDCWPLTRSIQDNVQQHPHTHERPIVAMCYSNNQVASVCAEATLKVWEADTGRLVFIHKDIHGTNVDITSMTVDPSGNRLATGGYDGSIKIWNFGTGDQIKHKPCKYPQPTPDTRITGMYYSLIKTDLFLLVCEASNIIKMYLDANDMRELNLIKILNGSIDALYYEISYGNKHDIVPPITNSMYSMFSSESAESKSRLSSAQLSKLQYHKIRCSFYCDHYNWLITGNKELAVWDVVTESLKDIHILQNNELQLPAKIDGSRKSLSTEPIKKDDRINCILVIVNSIEIAASKSSLKDNSKQSKSVIDSSREHEARENSNSGKSRKSSTATSLAESQISNEEGEDESSENEEDAEEEEEKKKEAAITSSEKLLKPLFKYLIVTGHNDSSIKIWNENAQLVNQMPPISSIKGSPITSMCSTSDYTRIFTSDLSGYITIWSLSELLAGFNLTDEIDLAKNSTKVSMTVCWRAHLTRIVRLCYSDQTDFIFSASIDESARVWSGSTGKYIGFLGQPKPFVVPRFDTTEWIAPYDINEPPIYFNKSKTDKRTIEKNYDYPLVLDKKKLIKPPLKRESTEAVMLKSISRFTMSGKTREDKLSLPNERYFGALVKPKKPETDANYKSLIADGSVFSSLPLYRETTINQLDMRTILQGNANRLNKDFGDKKQQKPKGNFKIIK